MIIDDELPSVFIGFAVEEILWLLSKSGRVLFVCILRHVLLVDCQDFLFLEISY